MDDGDDNPFTFESSDTEETILRKLKRLQDENESSDIFFVVDNILLTERISNEMIVTFQHVVNSGRQINKATFCDTRHPDTGVHFHSVLQAPVTSQLFRELSVNNYHSITSSGPMGIQFANALAVVLRNGRRVNIEHFPIGNHAMSVLSDGLVSRGGDVGPQELELFGVSFLNDGESSEGRSAEQCFANGLALNKTLTTFRILEGHSSDSTTAMIVGSLIGHPSLKKLELGQFEFGELTIRAVCSLLAYSTCKVSDLILSIHVAVTEGAPVFDVQRFIEQLPVNTSIQSLELSFFGGFFDHDSANLLLRSLWKFPSLKRLDLTGNAIEDFDVLASGITMATPHSCLRELNLRHNQRGVLGQSISDKQKATRGILRLLDVFPELGDLGDGVAEQLPGVIERLDLNRCSGMLLRGAEIPLSVWAVVLAKVNTDPILKYSSTTSRKANVFYQMLHGPVFEGRGRLD